MILIRIVFSGLQLKFEFTDGFEMMHKAWSSIEEVSYYFSRSSIKFQGHTGQKSRQIERFQTVTPVWIYLCLWNDASLK